MKRLRSIVCVWICFSLLTSCYTYREVFNQEQDSMARKMEMVKEKLEPGDRMDIEVGDKKYMNLEIADIQDPYIIIWQGNTYGNRYQAYIRIDQIKNLKFYDHYREIGGPYTGLLILLYLII